MFLRPIEAKRVQEYKFRLDSIDSEDEIQENLPFRQWGVAYGGVLHSLQLDPGESLKAIMRQRCEYRVVRGKFISYFNGVLVRIYFESLEAFGLQ